MEINNILKEKKPFDSICEIHSNQEMKYEYLCIRHITDKHKITYCVICKIWHFEVRHQTQVIYPPPFFLSFHLMKVRKIPNFNALKDLRPKVLHQLTAISLTLC